MNFYDYESTNSLYNLHDIFPRIIFIPVITRILCKSQLLSRFSTNRPDEFFINSVEIFEETLGEIHEQSIGCIVAIDTSTIRVRHARGTTQCKREWIAPRLTANCGFARRICKNVAFALGEIARNSSTLHARVSACYDTYTYIRCIHRTMCKAGRDSHARRLTLREWWLAPRDWVKQG